MEEARALDASDSLRHLRSEFIIPTEDDLRRKTLSPKGTELHVCAKLMFNVWQTTLPSEPNNTPVSTFAEILSDFNLVVPRVMSTLT